MTPGNNDCETPERDTALLTKAQRRHILGIKEYSGTAKRQVKKRIRKRLYDSMLDVELLARHYDLEELDHTFENIPKNTKEPPEAPHAQDAIASFAALKYLVHRDLEERGAKTDGWRISQDVEKGLKLALVERLDIEAEIDVNIEITRRGPLEIVAEYVDDHGTLEEISFEQLEALFKAGYISGEEHAQAFLRKKKKR